MRATLYTILHFFIRENIIVASAVTALALSTFYIFHQQPILICYLYGQGLSCPILLLRKASSSIGIPYGGAVFL